MISQIFENLFKPLSNDVVVARHKEAIVRDAPEDVSDDQVANTVALYVLCMKMDLGPSDVVWLSRGFDRVSCIMLFNFRANEDSVQSGEVTNVEVSKYGTYAVFDDVQDTSDVVFSTKSLQELERYFKDRTESAND